jgi:hypothetical protein
MIVLIKLKNIGNEIIKLLLKYSPNLKCISKENNLKEKKLLLLKYKLSSEHIMPESSSKNNKLLILIKKILLTLHIKLPSFKKYSEDSLSENIYITFIKENNNLKPSKKEINNSNNLSISLVKPKLFKLNNIKSSYQKFNSQHWLKIYII